jgi:hypothetical protein
MCRQYQQQNVSNPPPHVSGYARMTPRSGQGKN